MKLRNGSSFLMSLKAYPSDEIIEFKPELSDLAEKIKPFIS